MNDTPWHVTPTDPPTMAVLIEADGIPPGGWRIVDADGEVHTAGLIPDAAPRDQGTDG